MFDWLFDFSAIGTNDRILDFEGRIEELKARGAPEALVFEAVRSHTRAPGFLGVAASLSSWGPTGLMAVEEMIAQFPDLVFQGVIWISEGERDGDIAEYGLFEGREGKAELRMHSAVMCPWWRETSTPKPSAITL